MEVVVVLQLFIVHALFNVVTTVISTSQLSFAVNYPNELISPNEVDSWTSKHDLSLILFYNEVTSSGTSADVVDRFQKVGAKLNGYGVHFGVYNCVSNPTPEHCSDGQSHGVAAYLKGEHTSELPISALFDEYSIISNSLHLLLTQEVPMLQTVQELTSYIQQTPVFLLAIVKGVGCREHAHYMELAKASMDAGIKLSFAHSTTESILSSFSSRFPTHKVSKELRLGDEDAQLYYVTCDEHRLAERCSIYQYLRVFESDSLSGYVQLLTFSGQLADAIALKLPMARCYHGNDEERMAADKLIHEMSEEFKGTLLFYSLFSSEATEQERLSYSEMGTYCVIQGNDSKVKASVRLNSLRKYLVDEVLMKMREKEESAEELSDADAIIKAVETADDTVDILDNELGGLRDLDLSNLVILDRESFNPKMFTGVVLFHLMKHDYRNRMVLRLYNEAAANLTKGTLSILDCYDWTDVCKKMNIAEFPTIRMYKRGKHVTYSGPLSVPGFIKMAQMSEFNYPHEVDTMTDVVKLRAKLMAMNVTLIVVGLFDNTGSSEYKAYRDAARSLAGQRILMLVKGKLAQTLKVQLKLTLLPAIASYDVTEKDMNEAIVRFERKTVSSKAIELFVMRSTLPSFAELTPTTLPLLQISRQPQVLLFSANLKGEAFASVQLLSEDKSLKIKFGFGYLPLNNNPLNQRVLRTLTGGDRSTSLLVCDYSKGKLYEYKSSLVPEDVKAWLKQISAGQLEPSRDLAEGEWKAVHPGYDYLDLIEQEKKKKKAEHDRLNILPKEDTSMGTSAPSPTTGSDNQENLAMQNVATDGSGHQHTEL
ncbi:thioredoxin domain-containing protein 16-like isoform X2 [Watersipora subatra]|uniref:thioredoxin domain-containing protein 16-like isoform X2 n=1 Tax=Watersipora subatra TaxID=2589382 RepID=UPI00355B760C